MNKHLSRQFSIVSLTSIIIIAVIIGLLYRFIATNQVIQQVSNANIHLTEIIANTILVDTKELLDMNPIPSTQWPILKISRKNRLAKEIKRLSNHQTITKIKLFNLDGYVVFSTKKEELGTKVKIDDNFLSAKEGKPSTERKFKKQLTGLNGKTTFYNRELFSSYVPVKNNETGEVIGVFEMYSDATDAINAIQKTEYMIYGSVTILLSLLYLFLYFYIRKVGVTLIENEKQLEITNQKILHFLTNFDEMTELPNRSSFNDDLDILVTKHADNSQFFAVLIINIDRMDWLNSYGVGFGNKVIIKTANHLNTLLRDEDRLYRIDGSEFGIILQTVSDTKQVEIIAERFQENFKEPVRISDRDIHLSLSLGISSFPDNTQNKDDLIAYASSAMHRAKAIGGNNYMLYSPDIIRKTMQLYEMEISLRQALNKGQFEVYYQPKVNITQTRVVGAEALIRWNHPERGLVNPDEFIPLLESTGQIIPVGQWVMEQACIQCKRWHDLGYTDMSIAVNISAKQFISDLLIHTQEALSDSGLPPEFLELEITESILAKDASKAIEILSIIKQNGIKLSIDDFGTGYSSLNYLASFPVDYLKVDRSFINDITTNKRNASITETIIAMSKALEMAVIVEGIETEEQLEYVRNMHCELAQGYLFSKPVPEEEFIKLLEDRDYQLQKSG